MHAAAVVVAVLKEPLLLYKLLTNSSPAACEPASVEATDSSQARGPLPDLSYDDSQSSVLLLSFLLRDSQTVCLCTVTSNFSPVDFVDFLYSTS